jgi:fucose permease
MAFATALLLLARSPSAAWVASFAVGIAMAPVLPTALAMAGEALPRWPAVGMGIALAAGWLGVAVSSPLIARIADRSSLPTAMLMLPALSLAMALLARTRPRAS